MWGEVRDQLVKVSGLILISEIEIGEGGPSTVEKSEKRVKMS
jgi:hypothetical protein